MLVQDFAAAAEWAAKAIEQRDAAASNLDDQGAVEQESETCASRFSPPHAG
jgi:hypothetical protein